VNLHGAVISLSFVAWPVQSMVTPIFMLYSQGLHNLNLILNLKSHRKWTCLTIIWMICLRRFFLVLRLIGMF